ncbi:MAG: NADH:ubiquinone reductase (Na(+)-transporting) subunit C [Bacteroidales bacterium]|nr:NADH:ubiquinone reductase (Na(+)-transporting) subunit C [Bacteroidales bacterium]
MKNYSNGYIFRFAAIMVIFVAAILAVVAKSLSPRQQQNVKTELMKNILSSAHIESGKNEVEELFNANIVESFTIDSDGDKTEEAVFDVNLIEQVAYIDAINKLEESMKEKRVSPFKKFISNIFKPKEKNVDAVRKEIDAVKAKRRLPVYVCKKDGEMIYILPIRGKGLWGPVWGYVALEDDFNTVYGAVFDHKSETPGLGAEINTSWFEANFNGKKLFENGQFVSIMVEKGGKTDENVHAVDAISGGTITSKGVEAMLYDCIKGYIPFFEKNKITR